MSASEAYRHHGTRARSGHKDAACVRSVLVNGVSDHAGDALAIAASIVLKRGIGAHVPAASRVRRLGVDDDEVVLLRQRRILGSRVVGRCCASAVVDGDDNGRVFTKAVGHVDVHSHSRRIVSKVRDLCELGGASKANQGRGPRQDVLQGDHDGDKMDILIYS